MTGTQGFDVNTRLVTTGVILIGVGSLMVATGAGLTTTAIFAASRRWVQQLETPPSEIVKQNYVRARRAAEAGVGAWRTTQRVRRRAGQLTSTGSAATGSVTRRGSLGVGQRGPMGRVRPARGCVRPGGAAAAAAPRPRRAR